MGDQDSLPRIRKELHEIGQEAYQVELLCPHCQSKFREFWQRFDWLDSKVQRLSFIEEENGYLRYRIDRYLDFGEALDDLR
ncbi:hypothetical protein HJG54_23125 [Leptolyngbya sp. NK1-12]|uniref:Uncharacterized protein n=1 Tax=Leptolyngbya sp. NK1-12 TaxID=2547451 RepID=A0AA96WN19_9CYAN|nr:hypothetical protein [Leptolyngbya sp. NK1-12]WNZ25461.1 hypothetical protein HJG54_23125 [Leptolyngbya sp. NK1-12]